MIRTLFATGLILVMSLAAVTRAQEPPARKTPAPSTASAPAPAQVNLNTATKAELETLPGVGPAMATRILEYRQKNGAFKKIEELMNVQGIGEKSFLKLKALVVVAPPKTA